MSPSMSIQHQGSGTPVPIEAFQSGFEGQLVMLHCAYLRPWFVVIALIVLLSQLESFSFTEGACFGLISTWRHNSEQGFQLTICLGGRGSKTACFYSPSPKKEEEEFLRCSMMLKL
ncbi:peptide chain release factor 1, mitochondrial [Platysternon megacephalum]|uniref:Peptide chain release factor 1, mitochondrial n=1 Tax=Platysternon megacephalum TaxID=55544 RepID=A0A4D9FFA5_9SAUR|nr:peptide chain release factor 1, mitochondrial [Platysternon megacephalum]